MSQRAGSVDGGASAASAGAGDEIDNKSDAAAATAADAGAEEEAEAAATTQRVRRGAQRSVGVAARQRNDDDMALESAPRMASRAGLA